MTKKVGKKSVKQSVNKNAKMYCILISEILDKRVESAKVKMQEQLGFNLTKSNIVRAALDNYLSAFELRQTEKMNASKN